MKSRTKKKTPKPPVSFKGMTINDVKPGMEFVVIATIDGTVKDGQRAFGVTIDNLLRNKFWAWVGPYRFIVAFDPAMPNPALFELAAELKKRTR